MRNHGWELPYHPFQTVAVAVFSGISFSFYVFFIPFVGSSVLKFHIYAVFSPVVLAVFILYVRCAGCDPADVGVHQSKRAVRAQQRAAQKARDLTLPNIDPCFEHPYDESERNQSESIQTFPKFEATSCPSVCARWLCLPFACSNKDDSAKLNAGEQLLYCSICEAEISKNSKHCRACDKCVHGFDHHCRWLNNCVGKRNYRTFVSLMMACLLLLIIVWTTGIGVLVRCFSEKTSFEKEILHRLGSSFSRVPYIIVVMLLSLLAMLATIPLCQLFFFHLILIHKGITTYDYILAIREQAEQDRGEAGDGVNSLTSSPASSNATGVSAGFSSAGAPSLHRGVFCTPPRMFVEHHQKVLAFRGDLESSGTNKMATNASGAGPRQPHKKIAVGINPWKLARMNPEEATKATAQARETSTILRPIMHSKGSSQVLTETEDSSLELSSRDVSGEITIAGNRRFNRAYLTGKERWLLMKDRHGKNVIAHNRPTGIQTGALTANPNSQSMVPGFRCSPSRFSGGLGSYPGSSYPGSSYPGSQMASPDIFQESLDQQTITRKPSLITEGPEAAVKELPENGKLFQGSELKDGYEASAGESGDEKYSGRLQGLMQTLIKSTLDSTSVVITPSEKLAVWEDGNQENAKPRTSSGSRSLGSRGSRSSRGESTGGRTESSSGSRAEANILKHVRKEWPQLRDRLSVSPDASTDVSASPTHNNSPARAMNDPTLITASEATDRLIMPHGILVPSTRRLKESLIKMGKKKNSAKLADGLVSKPTA